MKMCGREAGGSLQKFALACVQEDFGRDNSYTGKFRELHPGCGRKRSRRPKAGDHVKGMAGDPLGSGNGGFCHQKKMKYPELFVDHFRC